MARALRAAPFLSSMGMAYVNALIDFLGPAQDPKPPASRGVENLDAMQQSWNKVEVREAKLEADPAPRLEDLSGFAMREAIAKLRLTSSPVQFWLAMMNELPRGATADQKESHLLFCKTAADISSIVGHTCGVERAGKAYKQRCSHRYERLWRRSVP